MWQTIIITNQRQNLVVFKAGSMLCFGGFMLQIYWIEKVQSRFYKLKQLWIHNSISLF